MTAVSVRASYACSSVLTGAALGRWCYHFTDEEKVYEKPIRDCTRAELGLLSTQECKEYCTSHLWISTAQLSKDHWGSPGPFQWPFLAE